MVAKFLRLSQLKNIESPGNIENSIKNIVDEYLGKNLSDIELGVVSSHLIGSVVAKGNLVSNPMVSFDQQRQQSIDYAKKHTEKLVEKGGTTINGKFVPWLENASTELRDEIAKVINDGLEEGKSRVDIKKDLKAIYAGDDTRIDKIASWEIPNAQYHGSLDQYEEDGITVFEWLLGDMPCPVCEPLGQKRYFTADELPEDLPHNHCMCDISPVTSEQAISQIHRLMNGGEGSGESSGHPYRGNQYGEGNDESLKSTNDHKEYDTRLIKTLADGGGAKLSDKIAQSQDAQLSKNLEYSKSHEDQLGNYTGSGYVEINKSLRSDGPTTAPIYAKMDKAIEGSPELPRGTVMYRGVGEHSAQRLMSMKPGDTCNDKAYQSFSTSPRIASTFTSYTENKGKRDAVIIRAVVDGRQRGFVVGGSEHEIIMPRGTGWKVVSNNAVTTGVNAGKVTTHMITVVPI